ncbi:MAG: hypothetical protein AAF206_26005 [Bacteroidota bacterium]
MTQFRLIIPLLFASAFFLSATPPPDVKILMLAADFSEEDMDTLQMNYGQNKVFIDQYKKVSLVALSYYPELKETDIEFVHQKLNTTLAARPKMGSVFKKAGKRKYQIFINNHESCEIPLDAAPFNAQVGVIGHELAHIVDYEKRNTNKIFGAGLSYATRQSKASFEKQTDRITIEHGLGWQLHHWADFVLKYSKANDKYLAFKERIYLTPKQILTYMEGLKMY